MSSFGVVSPIGLAVAKAGRGAKRLASLDGMTIGEIWNGDFKGDITFPMIRERLLARFPSLRIVPYTEFPHVHVADNPAKQRERVELVARLAREKRCDAVISGNGA
jgi:hypothetical protein